MGGAEHAGPTSNGTHHGVHERDSSFLGVCMMLIAVLGGAFKYVFAHATIKKYREELGVLAFTLWVEVFVGAMLLPWALINGELQTLLGSDHSIGDWVLRRGGIRWLAHLLAVYLPRAHVSHIARRVNLAIQALTIILAIMAFGTEPTAALILDEEIQMGCDRTVFPRTAQDLD